jgi:hypothetical protein
MRAEEGGTTEKPGTEADCGRKEADGGLKKSKRKWQWIASQRAARRR